LPKKAISKKTYKKNLEELHRNSHPKIKGNKTNMKSFLPKFSKESI
jgi:hypothetical protein